MASVPRSVVVVLTVVWVVNSWLGVLSVTLVLVPLVGSALIPISVVPLRSIVFAGSNRGV